MRIGGKTEVSREKWDEGKEGRRRALRRGRDVSKAKAVEGRLARAMAGQMNEAGRDEGAEEEEEEEDEDVLLRVGGVEVIGDWTRTRLYGVGR